MVEKKSSKKVSKKKKTKKSLKKTKKRKTKKELPKKESLLSRIKLPSLGLIKKASLNMSEVKSIEDEIRDLINWVSVFEKEYDLPKEVTDKLLRKLHSIARKVGWLRCK